MISNLLAIIYGFTIAIGVLLVIKFNNNPQKITTRGKRVIFVCFILVGFFVAQFILHTEMNCDLRDLSSCEIRWI